ncbi:hypothetical protein QAD02_002142 [Eretmocerus hayati]|uniref:Uncharacterized protein n=1 Tax=Eretmocerus hayati TaxID=131215 RepID=A0ACC2NI76_9HYME|nr:hypothetical protein QAD02_002142 [Eretmocerus hayati]
MAEVWATPFKKLALHCNFASYSEFEDLFKEFQYIYQLKYNKKSSKLILNDRRYKNKGYNPAIIYSELELVCNGKKICDGAHQQCPSSIKLYPTEKYSRLRITAVDLTHNHPVEKSNDKLKEQRIKARIVTDKLYDVLMKVPQSGYDLIMANLEKWIQEESDQDDSCNSGRQAAGR